jgi:uncharacterized membrane protein
MSTATVTQTASGPPSSYRAYRLSSIDMLRGLVIVLMAIDHVRDFFFSGALQDPTTDPNVTAAMFATRWITHFCAPVFVCLAGTSAGLMASRKTPRELGRFLFTRGIWLVFVEIFIISTFATFAPWGIADIGGLVLIGMQVIWAIGASMIVVSALQWFGRRACLAVGLLILCTHNLLDPIWPASQLMDQQWPAWVALHSQMALHVGPFLFGFIYPVLAWVGVMLLGFGAAGIFEKPPEHRNTILIRTGVGLTVGFLLLRAIGAYGDPNPWQLQPAGMTATIIDFLNTTKYPPSLLFLLMTLGPASILCGIADRFSGGIKETLIIYGRAPFAFYVAHFFVIHVLSVLLGVVQGFTIKQMLTMFMFYPKGYGVGLPGVYAVWALVVVLLYPLCRWVSGLKARRKDWWLSYV